MSYKAVGRLLGDAITDQGWTHEAVADALRDGEGVSRPYITGLVAGGNPVSAERVTEILDIIKASDEMRVPIFAALKAVKDAAKRAGLKRRQAKRGTRQARPLDIIDAPSQPAEAIRGGSVDALAAKLAELEARLERAGIPYYRPYQTAA